ncbi:MAG: hypothetical protein WC651_03265 [Candidatus Gracilibacteria bacterium]|jgi:hypothetical protein
MLRALAWGLLFGSAIASLFWIARPAEPWPWRLWGAALLCIAAAAWFLESPGWKRTLWSFERRSGRDIDGDGVTGKPEPGHTILIDPEKARRANEADAADVERLTRVAKLRAFVNRCYEVGSTAEAKHNVKPGDRAEYLAMRDTLFRLGLADWRVEGKPGAGWRLVHSHFRTLKVIAEHVADL